MLDQMGQGIQDVLVDLQLQPVQQFGGHGVAVSKPGSSSQGPQFNFSPKTLHFSHLEWCLNKK